MSKNETKLEISYVSISELIPADYNPRKMTESDRRAISASIKTFGLVDPVIVNRHPDRMNIIVGGHQRTVIASELGYTEMPCVFVELDLEKEKELNVRLNKNTGRFDEIKLLENFNKEFLEGIGFKSDELGFFLSDFEQKMNKMNDSNCEMPIVPKFSELYDAVIIVSSNSIDTQFLETALEIDKAHSYKNSRTGKAMIISVDKFKEVWQSR